MAGNNIDIRSQLDAIAGEQGFSTPLDLGEYVANVVSLALSVGGIIFFIYLVWGGIKWLMSGSDTAKVDEAKKHLTNATIGLTIVAVSWAVFAIANEFFGLGLIGTSPRTPASAMDGRPTIEP